jgi:hypothetical protein
MQIKSPTNISDFRRKKELLKPCGKCGAMVLRLRTWEGVDGICLECAKDLNTVARSFIDHLRGP